MSEKLIYTVGDSHCWHAWLKIPFVETQTRGPMLMHTFGQGKPIVVDEIPAGKIVVFCWGEIDCRCHVHKYQPWQDTVDRLVENYFAAIKANDDGTREIWVFNVVPPPRRCNAQGENPGFPFLGTDAERLSYVWRMNQRLKDGPYQFIDIYDHYADAEGFLRMELSDGHVHIADERPLTMWLSNQLSSKVDPIFLENIL